MTILLHEMTSLLHKKTDLLHKKTSLLLKVTILPLLFAGELMRRLIGIIYLHQDNKTVRIAHTTFFGKRRDILVNIEDFKLVSDTNANVHDVMWKVEFYDKSLKNMLICTRFGGVADHEKFVKIFGAESLSNYKFKS